MSVYVCLSVRVHLSIFHLHFSSWKITPKWVASYANAVKTWQLMGFFIIYCPRFTLSPLSIFGLAPPYLWLRLESASGHSSQATSWLTGEHVVHRLRVVHWTMQTTFGIYMRINGEMNRQTGRQTDRETNREKSEANNMSREHNLTGLQLQNILALINLQSQLVIPCKGRERAYSGYSKV